MLQLGLLREDDSDGFEGKGGRRERQPVSHDSALPPGFGTLERNGMNGAKVSRRGKLSGGRTSRAGSGEAYPSDPYGTGLRSEEHTSELQSLMRNSYAVFCLKKKEPTE